ncbi:MAG: imelysin family protein [Pseudomonadota bacterium]
MKIKTLIATFMLLSSLIVAGCGGGGGSSGGGNTTGGDTGGGSDGGNSGGDSGGGATDPLGAVGTKEQEAVRLFTALADDIIGPDYAGFQTAVGDMQTLLGGLCATPSTASLSEAQQAWRDAMDGWQRVQGVRFGPVDADNVYFRIQFFPDNNDAVLNNVGQVLAATDPVNEALIAGSAVGAQGLPALEYLLFELQGLDDPTDGPRRCDLVNAIGANLATMAADLVSQWQQGGAFYTDFVNASGTSFIDVDDVLTTLLEALALQAESIGDQKLRDAIANGEVDQLESYRAEHSLANLRQNIAAYADWMDDSEDATYRVADYVQRVLESDTLADQVAQEITAADTAADSITATLEDIVAGQATGDIESVRLAFQNLADLMVDIAVAAGLELGFNNQDGD